MEKGLVIVHVDGLGYDYLRKAIDQGLMPFTRRLIEQEGYEPLPYRCGLPSTTPYCQAGILYGDNTNIPSFRWWDKESGLLVAFGGNSSFRHVAHKYFKDCAPLAAGGACIAACYSGGAKDTFGLAYRDTSDGNPAHPHSSSRVLLAWLSDPRHLLDWVLHGTVAVAATTAAYWEERLNGRSPARMYVFSDMLEEIFLHHLTRFAVRQAMREGAPVIYGGFYAYDETSHAFGPEGSYTLSMLQHIDRTILRIAETRRKAGRDYEIVVLSDHGQIETKPFTDIAGQHLADLIAGWLPTYVVEEYRGKRIAPGGAIDGHIALTYSGGLGHLYFKDIQGRLERAQMEARFPGLLEKFVGTEGVGFVMLRDGESDLLCSKQGEFRLSEQGGAQGGLNEFLRQFDEPEIIARQLHKLNSFERSGDLILFGSLEAGKQVNFENQVGGHGSVGGEQLHPFILAKKEWGLDTRSVDDASDVYGLLSSLRDRLLGDRQDPKGF